MSDVVENEVKVKKTKAAAKTPPPPLDPNGLILYSDAGVKPNPGFAGWGVHGYYYNLTEPKKGSGNPTAVPTLDGYVMKSSATTVKPIEVTPLVYVDGFGSVMPITNNAAEIVAATKAIQFAAERKIDKLTLFTDSDYVVKGVMERLDKWASTGWVKADGQPIANTTQWQEMYESLNVLKDKEIAYDLRWIKGHNGHLGNTIVDNYATIGRRLSASNIQKSKVALSPAEGYWSDPHERHPFIHHPCSYLTTAMASEVTGEYYLGNHGKDDDVVGKRDADGAYAYIQLTKQDDYIELLKRKTLELATRDDQLVMCRLDKLFERFTLARLNRFDDDCLYQPNPKFLSLNISEENEKDEPITTELNPPRIAQRAIDSLAMLKGLLLDWKDNPQTELVGTDITDLLYEVDSKGVTRLKACYTVGFTALDVVAKYGNKAEPKEINLSLAVGLDLPERNALKKLEKTKPRVTVITWRESDLAIRYATIVECQGDYGIWAAFYANLKYLK